MADPTGSVSLLARSNVWQKIETSSVASSLCPAVLFALGEAGTIQSEAWP